MKIKFIGFYTLNHFVQYVYFNISSINLKENKKETKKSNPHHIYVAYETVGL